ncbi:MAG: hypothetical protein R3200_14900, partial [Xanthomonadales bacterium]|nr:hypothetical protein [Xanthomonadales bacterium]
PAAQRLWRRHPRALIAAVLATALLVTAGYLGWTQIREAETRSQAMSELASNISEGATDRISSSSFELSGGAIADNPDLERELAFLTAQALLNAQRPADAISMLEAILARARGSFEAPDRLADLLYLLGEAHRREGNMTLALRHLSAAESELRGTQSPLWQKSVTSLAAAHLRNDNLAQAADLMADAAIVEPDLLAAARHLRSLDESNCSSDGDGLVEPLRTEIAAWCAAHAAQ